MKSAEERFWENVIPEPNSGCWLWVGYNQPLGYGRFRVKGRKTLAHRFSYELHLGCIPNGMVLDHLCRNPSCVNPEHLEPVTQKSNSLRGLRNQFFLNDYCANGHEYSEENTRVSKDGSRICRKCQCIWQANARSRKALGLAGKSKNDARTQPAIKQDRESLLKVAR